MVTRYELILLARKLFMKKCWWQKYCIYRTFLYLAFKVNQKTFFIKNEVFGKNIRFSNIGKNTKENILEIPF